MQFSKTASALLLVVAAQLALAAPIPDTPVRHELIKSNVSSGAQSAGAGSSGFSSAFSNVKDNGGNQSATGGTGGEFTASGSSIARTTGNAQAFAENDGQAQNKDNKVKASGSAFSTTDMFGKNIAETTSDVRAIGTNAKAGQNTSAIAQSNTGFADSRVGGAASARNGWIDTSGAATTDTRGNSQAAADGKIISKSDVWIEGMKVETSNKAQAKGDGRSGTFSNTNGFADPFSNASTNSFSEGNGKAGTDIRTVINTGNNSADNKTWDW